MPTTLRASASSSERHCSSGGLRRWWRSWRDPSGSADLNQYLAGNLGVRGNRECLGDVLKWQYVSDHLLDLRVLIEQGDGGVYLVVEAKGAPELYLLRH